MKAVAIMNNKGGTAKTVTAVNLADILVGVYHKTVLLVDCDGQANATRFFLPNFHADMDNGTAAVLCGQGESVWSDNVVPVVPGLDILTGGPDLYGLDLRAMTDGVSNTHALRSFVDAARSDGETDFVLFDCPPGFTSASVAALMAADEVIIPMALDGFSFDGLHALRQQVENLRRANYRIKIAGVLITKWCRTQAVQESEKMLRSGDLPVYRTHIRQTPKVTESTLMQTPLRTYSPTSGPTKDYLAWVQEYLEDSVHAAEAPHAAGEEQAK